MKNISKRKIAEIYVKALLEVSKDDALTVLNEMKILQNELEKDSHIQEYFSSPFYDIKEKLSALDEICKKANFSEKVCKFLAEILKNNRFNIVNDIINAYEKAYMEQSDKVYVTVQSVKELSKKQDIDLQNELKSLLSKDVIIKYEIKPEILGGLVIQYEDKLIDDSLKEKINRLDKAMKGA